jgi:hypothetical protein
MNAIIEDRIFECFTGELARAEGSDTPYPHWIISDIFPDEILSDLQSFKFPVAPLDGVSGKRELHNDTRHYFDQKNIAASSIVAAVANAFQAPRMIAAIEKFFLTKLQGTFLRIEYAQDITGFWLEPHTDLGVKKLTVLICLSDGEGHESLGTDIFAAKDQWAARLPFAPNIAMAFVPGDNTYHGFRERPINGVRKSLILNYVTKEWRDREQLAFPDQTVSSH